MITGSSRAWVRVGTFIPMTNLYPIAQQSNSRTLTYMFEKAGKGIVRYSHQQLTKMEVRVAAVCWVAGSQWAFSIVSEPKFWFWSKTSNPG